MSYPHPAHGLTSFFRGIHYLPAGRFLEVDLTTGERRERVYWDAGQTPGQGVVALKAFLDVEITREQLEETVEQLSKTLWLSPALVAEVLRRAREAKP